MTVAPFVATQTMLDTLELASPFAKNILDRHPDEALAFLTRFFDKPLKDEEFIKLIWEFVGLSHTSTQAYQDLSEAQVSKGLRQLRNFLMLKWIWQDALSLVSLETLMHELSVFADACLNFCYEYVYANLMLRYGEPITRYKGKTIKDSMAMIAMGKLGAMELNLSSDIDLIFIHLGMGQTNGNKSIDTQKFMNHLGRGIIRLLNDATEYGFVFRVDMRLRPWGDGSPLVMSLPALHKYFNQHGRTWERFAWLKARVVNAEGIGDGFLEQLTQLTKNFVHRYYVDYTAFSALREMKTMIINQQAQRQDLDNVKLGVGGIRDIEFIVQAFALIYGGHHPIITQNSSCLDTIKVLSKLGYLQNEHGQDLERAYRFLRRLEHAIQARHDQQTQKLPSNDHELAAIAQVLGFADAQEFLSVLNTHRDKVSIPFNKLVAKRQNPAKTALDETSIYQALTTKISPESQQQLQEFLKSRLVASLDDEPKRRLALAYPALLNALLEHANTTGANKADLAVPRLIALLEAICRRSIYLVMIAENPNATIGLIAMLSASPWIAKELAQYPMLLDTFLQKRYLHLPDKAELTDILRQSLLRVEPFDDEQYLASIRVFKKTQVLAVATADILGLRHIMKVSDSLTFIAEVVLSSALNRAFEELISKHGMPKLTTGERASSQQCGFAIIGYGKLGGLEMSYASDLDVVFLHNIDEQAQTDGTKPVSGMKFASRLVQKVLNYLTTQTRDGRAYQMDMRLRPSGNAGVMIVSTHAFDLYQHQKAWAWEHQALVRARAIAGDEWVLKEFDRIRTKVLTAAREVPTVRQDVLHMRQKMQEHLGGKSGITGQDFHIKQDGGGLIDIEFLAQFMVLSYAHHYPNLTIWPDNVRIFEEVEKTTLWDKARCQMLTQAYLALRKKTHELALSDQKAITDDPIWQQTRAFVRGVWQEVIEAS